MSSGPQDIFLTQTHDHPLFVAACDDYLNVVQQLKSAAVKCWAGILVWFISFTIMLILATIHESKNTEVNDK